MFGLHIKPILIFLDRDGTIVKDAGNFLGSGWPHDTYEFMPGVVEGIRLLNSLPRPSAVVIASNQSGPARRKVKLEHITQVNDHIIDSLRSLGAIVQGSYFCHMVDEKYAAKHADIDRAYVVPKCNRCKPDVGMFREAAHDLFQKPLEDCIVYMIGDRTDSDVVAGLNAGGKSVFVQSDVREHSHVGKAHELKIKYNGRVYVAENGFYEAAEWIYNDALQVRHAKLAGAGR